MSELEQLLRRVVREELEARDRRRATAAPTPDTIADDVAERAIQHVTRVRAAGARRARRRAGGRL